MLAVLACIVILAVIGLGFYGLKSNTGWLRIQAGLWRFVTFSIEIGQPGPAEKPREERRALEAGHDKPRGLEAAREPASFEPPGAADQDDAAALRGLAADRTLRHQNVSGRWQTMFS